VQLGLTSMGGVMVFILAYRGQLRRNVAAAADQSGKAREERRTADKHIGELFGQARSELAPGLLGNAPAGRGCHLRLRRDLVRGGHVVRRLRVRAAGGVQLSRLRCRGDIRRRPVLRPGSILRRGFKGPFILVGAEFARAALDRATFGSCVLL
jgi:hypothetical protein